MKGKLPLGANLVLNCQRSDCDIVEIIELLPPPNEQIAELIPEGWGWDYAGVNTVFHCPDHRE